MEESQGIVREFCDECPQYFFYGSRHPFVPHLSASYGSRLHKSLHLFWCYVTFSAHDSFRGRKYVFAAHSLLKFGGMMHSTITHIAIYNGYARLLLCIHWTSIFSITGLDQVWRKLTHISKCEEITLQPEIWWHDEMHHEVDHYLKWPCIFWSRLTEGAVILWMSHVDMQDDYLSQHCCLYNDFLNFGVIYFIAFRNIVSWHHQNEPAN